MKSDIKLFKTLLKAGLNVKGNLIAFAIFVVLGIAFNIGKMFDGSNGMFSLGSFYLTVAATFISPMIATTSLSKLIQSSPLKKKIQVILPVTGTFITLAVLYILYAATTAILSGMEGVTASEEQLVTQILLTGALALVVEIYLPMGIKAYIPSLILMIVILIPVLFGLNGRFTLPDSMFSFGIGIAIIIGFALIVAGALLGMLAGHLLYRRDLSPMQYRAALNRSR